MTRWVLALVLILTPTLADAETVYQRCMRTGTCRTEIEKAIAAAMQAAVEAYKATLPCQTFAYADDGPTLGTGRACVVIENVQPCGENFCGTWPSRPEGEQ